VVEDEDVARTGGLLDELDALGVVHVLDLLLVVEALDRALVCPKLKASSIERSAVLLAAQVFHFDLRGLLGPVPYELPRSGIGLGQVCEGARAVSGACRVVDGRRDGVRHRV
jgi:hypothetical protein